MSKNKHKHQSSPPSANPDYHNGQQNTGLSNTHVRGEIEVKRAPSLTNEHETERREDTAHARKKFIVEKFTLAFVAVYAGVVLPQLELEKAFFR
jgi:hypothetical protein